MKEEDGNEDDVVASREDCILLSLLFANTRPLLFEVFFAAVFVVVVVAWLTEKTILLSTFNTLRVFLCVRRNPH